MAKLADSLKNFLFIIILLQIAPPIIQNIIKQYTRILEPQTKVAYIPVKGILYNSTPITTSLKKYFKDNDIKAILLKIDCPGSAAGTGEAIANEIALLKKEYPKPILSIAENICTSGGYYIAATTDHIISAPSTLLGSIGTTIPYQFKLDELLKKYDIKYVPITAGDYKNATDPFIAMTPEKQVMLESVTNSSYQNFIQHIANNRPKLAVDTSTQWADGKIFSGLQAIDLGLVDEIGSQSNAINKIKELAVIEGDIEWVRPEQHTNMWELFLGQSNTEGASTATPTLQQMFMQWLRHLTSVEKIENPL